MIPKSTSSPITSSKKSELDNSNIEQNNSQTVLVREISGVQTQNSRTVYVNGNPRASQLIRWPKQSNLSISDKLLVQYERVANEISNCDLTKNLCEAQSPLNTGFSFKIIEDNSNDSIILDDLALDSKYRLSVFVINNVKLDLKNVLPGRYLVFKTDREVVPTPKNVHMKAVPGGILISSNETLDPGFQLIFTASGGMFGVGTNVVALTGPADYFLATAPGFYHLEQQIKSPAGTLGLQGDFFEILVP